MKFKVGLFCLLTTLLLVSCGKTSNSSSELDKWLSTENAKDYDKNGVMDAEDYEFYKDYLSWKQNSKAATDYNNDGEINLDDFGFVKWIELEETTDYDEDGKLSVDDYLIYLGYSKWQEGEDALDFNGDRIIDYTDYCIYNDPEMNEYFKWLKLGLGKDYNEDSKIDMNDYIIYQYIGNYKVTNYNSQGNMSFVIAGTELSTKNIGLYIDDIQFNFDGKNIKIKLGKRLVELLGERYQDALNIFDNMNMNITSPESFNIVFETIYNDTPVKVALYFEYVNNGNYHTSYQFIDGIDNISFSLDVGNVKQ